jgi:hypothetical protein
VSLESPGTHDLHAELVARLLASRWLPRTDARVQRALIDEPFRDELDRRLAACGVRLLDNPFAEHVALALLPAQEAGVLRPDASWMSSNADLPRDAVALLVLLWALFILPKRERQIARSDAVGQAEMFSLGAASPASKPITEDALMDDFSDRLGGRNRLRMNMGRLRQLGFIEQKGKLIAEGPLLDLVFDYGTLAPRLLDSVVADLVRRRAATAASAVPPPAPEEAG